MSTAPHAQAQRISVRRMDFAFSDDIPTYWHAGDPFRTLLFTALSGTFPEGEKFFVDAVRNYRDQIKDPELQQAVSAFIGQEAHHAKGHAALSALMQRKGFPMHKIDRMVHDGLHFMRRRLSPQRQLAMTCALEHFTAILAELLLDHPELTADMDPRMKALWLWHAIEESEHKAVAYDVYQTTVGSYWVRVSQMVFNTLEFNFFTGLHFLRLLHHDGQLKDWRLMARGLGELYISPGWLRKVIPAYLQYYRPDFHPWQRDNSVTLEYWRRHLQNLRTELGYEDPLGKQV